MNKDVIVVMADKLIVVDGRALNFDFALPIGLPTNLHAIQWHDGKGEIEFTDDYNQSISGQELYDLEVAPFVALWEVQKAIEDKPPTLGKKQTEIRSQRDQLLADCDFTQMQIIHYQSL